MPKAEELESMLAPAVQALGGGLLLWGIEFVAGERRSLLRLYIDAQDRPIGIDDCEAVSREVSALLDVNDPISGNYDLEVSSPGLDRPLFVPAHFQRFVGQAVKVSLALPVQGRKRLQGVIAEAGEDSVRIVGDDGEWTVGYSSIQKAKLVPDFGRPAVAAGRGGRGKPGKSGR